MKDEDLTVPLSQGQSETLERIFQDRQRYKRERDELLQAFFQPFKTRDAVAKRLLGETDSLHQRKAKEIHPG